MREGGGGWVGGGGWGGPGKVRALRTFCPAASRPEVWLGDSKRQQQQQQKQRTAALTMGATEWYTDQCG